MDGFIAFDLEDCRTSAGGTRFAPDVSEHEAALLARAMSYKFGVLGSKVGGAKGAVRGPAAQKAELLSRYCEEIRPLVSSFTFLTGPDLGTSESDFAPLRSAERPKSVMASTVGGEPIEDLVTGFGVAVAAESALGTLDGYSFAIEGFGKVGGGVAREVVRRGARVVAISTVDGCVGDPSGLDVELALSLRREHGDEVVRHLGGERRDDPAALFEIEADVLVPGARTGVVTPAVAERLRTPWIVPAANVPYRRDALEVLRARRIRYLPDFVCNAGATIGYTSEANHAGELFSHVASTIARLMSEALSYPQGPFEGACAMAERFMSGWRGPDGIPPGPPLA